MSIRDLFPVGQKFEFELSDTKDVSVEAFTKVCEYVESITGKSVGTIVGSSWEDDDSNKYGPGNLTTRIGKYLYAHHGIKLTAEQKKTIGDMAARGIVKCGTYIFDFDDKLSWKQGDFGDGDACFIPPGSNAAYALPLLRYYKTLAARWFDEKGKGIARCWMLFPLSDNSNLDKRLNDQIVILANAYSSGMGLNLERQASIIKKWSNLKLTAVYCINRGAYSDFYLNSNGSNQSYALLTPEAEFRTTDKEIYLSWLRPPVTCGGCGCKCDRDHYYGDSWYCNRCFEYKFFICAKCMTAVPIEDKYSVQNYTVCETCYEKSKTCDHCGELFLWGGYRTVGGKVYCLNHYRDKVFSCRKCNLTTLIEDAYVYRGYKYCKRCTENSPTCCECGDRMPYGCMTVNRKMYCEDCFGKHYDICGHCSNFCAKEKSIKYKGSTLCEACGEETKCDLCDEKLPATMTTRRKYGGTWYNLCSLDKHPVYPCYQCHDYILTEKPCEHGPGKRK